MDVLLVKALKRVGDDRDAGVQTTLLDACRAEVDSVTLRTASRDLGGDVLWTLLLVVALVIAVRCRGAAPLSILWAVLFPGLYIAIYAGRNLLGDRSAGCGAPQGGAAWGGPPPPYYAPPPHYGAPPPQYAYAAPVSPYYNA
jgi:hypothetical protein